MIILNWRQVTGVLFIALLSLLFVQCQAPEVGSLEVKTFFDLKGFLDKEKERLQADKISFEKRIDLNGKSETKIIATPDFKVEFSEFYASDINRTAWLDKYVESKDEKGLHYVATEEKLEVRKLDIEKTEDGETIISILKQSKNMLNDSKKELYYHSAKGYSMKNTRKSIGESEGILEIDVKFQK